MPKADKRNYGENTRGFSLKKCSHSVDDLAAKVFIPEIVLQVMKMILQAENK